MNLERPSSTLGLHGCPVTVIVVAYHGDRWLADCIGTLVHTCGPGLHLVLVDNGGTSDTQRLRLSEIEHVVIRTPRAMGFAEANNFALQQVAPSTEAVCFLNQDTRSETGWLDACLACLERDPKIGAVSPLLRTYDADAWDPNFLVCTRRSEALRQALETDAPLDDWYEVPLITAAAMVVRTEALLKAGPFDPIFGSYYEDYDLCRRIRAAGYKVGIAGRGCVAHFSGSATRDRAAERRRMRQVIRNRAILKLREAGTRRWGVLARQFARALPYNLCRGLAGTPSSQPPSIVLGAHWDLLRIGGRLWSERVDRREWSRYLAELGWPCHSEQVGHSAEAQSP